MIYRKATLLFEIATLLCHEFNLFCRAEVLLPQWGSATRSGDTLLWCKVTLFFHIATLHWRKTILVFQKAMWLCAKTTLLFHEPTLLPDQDTLFRHNATQFQVQETLLFCGNTLFHHENTCFRGGVVPNRINQSPGWIHLSRIAPTLPLSRKRLHLARDHRPRRSFFITYSRRRVARSGIPLSQ